MKYWLGGLVVVLCFLLIGTVVKAEPLPRKPVHKVEVREFFLSQQDLSCKETPNALVTVWNRGNVAETVYVEVANNKLQINEFSSSIVLPKGVQQNIVVPLQVEKGLTGAYEFTIRLYSEEGIKTLYQTVHFRGCPKPKITSLITSAKRPLPFLQQEKEGEQEAKLSTSVLVAIGLVGVLAFLSMLFILVVFIREQGS